MIKFKRSADESSFSCGTEDVAIIVAIIFYFFYACLANPEIIMRIKEIIGLLVK
jgi:hypothetical protein